MTEKFNVACVQYCADDDQLANLQQAESLVRQASDQQADLICLPEYFSAIEVDDQATLSKAVAEEKHPALQQFRALAKELSVWMQIGSLPIKVSETHVNNRAFVVNDQGEIVARYNKIHLFDVALKDKESYQESNAVKPGEQATIADLPWGKLGMSICYDVRFPQLYRDLAQAGADFLSVPAAFTQTTGRAHWHTLLRSRAIENGCYVFATCQTGIRKNGRATFGHSLIIDPWGNILKDAGPEAGVIVAEVDPKLVTQVRKMIPSLQHDREYVQT
jgi:hypothetical protein